MNKQTRQSLVYTTCDLADFLIQHDISAFNEKNKALESKFGVELNGEGYPSSWDTI